MTPQHSPLGRVAVIGPHIVDVLGRPVPAIPAGQGGALLEEIRITVAGTGGGVASDLARLGWQVDSYGAVGDDALAGFLRGRLDALGVGTRGLVTVPGAVTSASILPIRPNGERPSLHVPGATGSLRVADLDRDALAAADVVLLGGPETMPALLQPDGLELLRWLRDGGRPVHVDLMHGGDPATLDRLAPLLPLVDWFTPNDGQLRALTGVDDLASAARRVIALGAGAVAVTLGGDGALVVRPGADDLVVPALPARVVDTTGCGDAFDGGLVTGLRLGGTVADAALLGNACGALVAGGLGSDAGIDGLAGVLDLVASVDPAAARIVAGLPVAAGAAGG